MLWMCAEHGGAGGMECAFFAARRSLTGRMIQDIGLHEIGSIPNEQRRLVKKKKHED